MSKSKDKSSNKPKAIGATLLESAIEALVFAAEEPISASTLSQTYSEATGSEEPGVEEVEATIARLNHIYESSSRSFTIQKWAGGYRFATRTEYASFLKALFVTDKQRKLSRTLMESLAILAYRQPTTRSELEFIRGVDSDYSIRKLLEYGLIDVIGRAESVGKPLLYGTTSRFLELFGLPELADLPNLRELESILDDPSFQKEKARLLLTTAVQLPLLSDEAQEQSAPDEIDPETQDVPSDGTATNHQEHELDEEPEA